MSDLPSSPSGLAIRGASLTPEQKRFNQLLARLDEARARLAAWHEAMARWRADHVRQHVPLLARARAARRRWVRALDAAAGRDKLSRADAATLGQQVCAGCAELLALAADDAEIKALHDRWAEVDHDTRQADAVREMKRRAEAATGLDLGPDDGVSDAADLQQRMREAMAAAAEAGAAAEAAAEPPRRRTAAHKRRETASLEDMLSVREIFRRLASAWHPDREADPVRRAAKTEWMQQANRAYAANDLLALLGLQSRLAQADAAHTVPVDGRQLRHYNRVLERQLAALQEETHARVDDFIAEFGLDPELAASPRRLPPGLARDIAATRERIARLEREARWFDDPASTRQWLRAVRKHRVADDASFEATAGDAPG